MTKSDHLSPEQRALLAKRLKIQLDALNRDVERKIRENQERISEADKWAVRISVACTGIILGILWYAW